MPLIPHTEYTDELPQTLEGMALLSLLAIFKTDGTKQIIQKQKSAWLVIAQTSKAVASKRLGHFTVSSQEEQIASALHDHSRDWPERGLCFPGGS